MALNLYELLVPSFALFSRNSLKHTTNLPILKCIKKSNQIHGPQLARHLSVCFIKGNSVSTEKKIWKRTLSYSHLNLQQTGKEKENNITEFKKEQETVTNIGEGTWQEVYSGLLTTQLKLVKMFSIGSSLIGLSMQPILYERLGNADVAVVVTVASFLGFFTFITPALIHWVSKKYVTKLEYDPKNDVYVATILSFFLREKKIHFKIEDVIRPDIPGMFTSFLVKNKPLFVDPSMFEDVDHYSRIMGYDKPIDFSYDRDQKNK